jgi:hypothetical protein
VQNQVRDDVGGDIQLGVATQAGLQIMSHVRPLVEGKPKARITFLGVDMLDLGSVGPCNIGLPGLA